MNHKFKKCNICGKVIEVMNQEAIPTICCGEEMQELVANTVDASVEKHVPAYQVNGDEIEVQIGQVLHPSEVEHHIMWIALLNDNNIVKTYLKPGDKPEAIFRYIKGTTIYAYCDLHGLWKKEVE